MSARSKKLYLANDYSLLSLSTRTAKRNGSGPVATFFGGFAYVNKVLYGIAGPGAAAIYIVNTLTGGTTFADNVQGESANAFGLAQQAGYREEGVLVGRFLVTSYAAQVQRFCAKCPFPMPATPPADDRSGPSRKRFGVTLRQRRGFRRTRPAGRPNAGRKNGSDCRVAPTGTPTDTPSPPNP